MFDLVTVRASEATEARRFYETVFPVLGHELVRGGAAARWPQLEIAPAGPDAPVTRRLHVGLSAGSRELVDEFWRAGVDAGYRDDGAPGERPQYTPDYYGGFLLDPDGNSIEAVHHSGASKRAIDHLWIRVADIAAATAFYASIATSVGFAVHPRHPEKTWCRGRNGSFTLIAGEPTAGVEMRLATIDGSSSALRDPDGNRVELAA